MPQKIRDTVYPAPIRSRLRAKTDALLTRAVNERGTTRGALIRFLIEEGLGQINDRSPVRKTRAPVSHPQELAAAVTRLGSIAGNLQRLYTVLVEEQRLDDPELQQLKTEVRKASRAVRQAIGEERDP